MPVDRYQIQRKLQKTDNSVSYRGTLVLRTLLHTFYFSHKMKKVWTFF